MTLNICIVISTPFPPEEGIGNHVYNVSKKLIERGHDVTIVTRGSLNGTQRGYLDGIEVFKVPFIPFYPFHVHIHGIFVDRLIRSLESSFDLVHMHTPLPPIIDTSLPKVLTVHTPMITDTSFIEVVDFWSLGAKIMGRSVSYLLELKMMKNSNIITTVSNSVAQELNKHYCLDLEEIVVIGNGVDEKTFTPPQQRSEEEYILYVGRLSYRKGLSELMECAKYVCQDYPEVCFVLAGKGPLEGMLRKRVTNMELQDRIKFLGYVKASKLVKLYQNALTCVIPSHYEGLSTVLLEAMSCGLPVVTTVSPEVVEDGENGILVPPKSPRKMAEAISVLLDDKGFRKLLGENARKAIEEKYTWDVVTDRIESCYKLIV